MAVLNAEELWNEGEQTKQALNQVIDLDDINGIRKSSYIKFSAPKNHTIMTALEVNHTDLYIINFNSTGAEGIK